MKSPTYAQFKHSGIVLDLPPEEVSPEHWTGGENVQFQDAATRRVGGYAPYASPVLGAGPMFALNVINGENSFWIYCTVAGVYVTDGALHWDITPAGGLLPATVGAWSGCVLNGIPVINNGLNPPMYWDFNTANKAKPLPGWPAGATCKAIRAFKYHLFALNVFSGTADYPSTLWWSKSALPGTIPTEWTPGPANDAGDMDLGDTPGEIVDGLALRDSLIVYKEFSTYSLSYVAGQFIYTSRKLFLTSGVAALNCIVEVDGAHFIFTGNDVIRTDGQNFESLVDLKVKHALVDSIDPAQRRACCVASRQRNNQIWVNIPVQGGQGLTRAYVINTLIGSVGIRDLPGLAFVARGIVNYGAASVAWDSDDDSWDSDVTFWSQQNYDPTEDSLLWCDQDANKLFAVDVSDLANGAPISAFVERASMPLGDQVFRGLVTRVVPRVEGQAGDTLLIRTGGQGYFDQPIAWSDPVPFVIGQDVGVNVLTEGRLISVRFEGATARQWKVHSYRVGFVDLGLY
jgi:hypothetical protein